MSGSFEKAYPALAWWMKVGGSVEIGYPGHIAAFIAALDEGGLIWEGETEYDSVDEALAEADAAIAEWREENM